MIKGFVNSHREAVVRLLARGPLGREQEVEAVLDTGFSGFMTLPASVITALNLSFHSRGRALLGDGSEVVFDTFEGIVIWHGQSRRILVESADVEPLLGMNVLYGSELTVQVVEGGDVVIRELPLA
jgi:clan AA aspartic protease